MADEKYRLENYSAAEIEAALDKITELEKQLAALDERVTALEEAQNGEVT